MLKFMVIVLKYKFKTILRNLIEVYFWALINIKIAKGSDMFLTLRSLTMSELMRDFFLLTTDHSTLSLTSYEICPSRVAYNQ